MAIREQSLGRSVRFLLPSLKLKQPGKAGRTVEEDVHVYLLENFGGYTASSGNLFGYWREAAGSYSYGEHRQFTVGVTDEGKVEPLKEYLASLATTLDEECLYAEIAGEALLIYGT